MEEIHIMIFSIMGTRLGVDMEQVFEIRELDQVEQKGFKAVYFHEKAPFRGKVVQYKAPKVLLIKDETSTGIIINQPENMINITIDDIQPLPPLLQSINKYPAIWGAAMINEEIVLLVDLYKLVEVNV